MNTQTLEHMKQLRLYGMYRAFDSSLSLQSTNYTSDELVAYLIQSEWDDRQDRKIERLTKAARFRYSAVMEAIDFDPSRCLDKNQIHILFLLAISLYVMVFFGICYFILK